tara:strand:- start:2346 stop:2543 length:198 start_codon:yes stop_codon:yes gene_type:complete
MNPNLTLSGITNLLLVQVLRLARLASGWHNDLSLTQIVVARGLQIRRVGSFEPPGNIRQDGMLQR